MSHTLPLRLKVLTASLIVALAFVGFNAWYLSNTMRSISLQQRWVEHTYQVINELEIVISSIKDADIGQRGYFINPNDKSLEIREAGIARARTQLDRVERLNADNPVQLQSVANLRNLLEERFAILNSALKEFNRTKRIESIRDDFSAGQAVMESIRKQIGDMINNERALLIQRTAAMDKQARFAFFMHLATSVTNLILITAFWFFFRRYMIAQDRETRHKAREAWIKSDTAEVASAIGGDLGLVHMAEAVVNFVSNKAKIPAVNLYLAQDGELSAIAGTTVAKRKSFRIGQGIVGQAAVSKSITVIRDVPEDFFALESSLGSARPKYLIYVPVNFRGELVGVMELASFGAPDIDREDWLQSIAEGIGAGFTAAQSRERLRELLEETQRQSEELQMQQEELRTSNEELAEQTKALLESQHQMQVQAEELRQVNEELESQARTLEAQQESLSLKNQALETSRRKLEEKASELERASAYKSEFLAKMSHELRTPLNSLMILATLLRENKESNLTPQQIEFSRTIYESGTDLLELINDILDLSKLEARKMVARSEPFPLRTLVDQIRSSFKSQADAKGIGFSIETDDGVPETMTTDRQRLLQIMRNLVSNAMKFTERGEVAVRIKKTDSNLEFIVKDTGVGIPEAKRRLIWEAFEQADSSVSRKFGGTGLGLTISRELASLLGGSINVDSEEGSGSCFTLTLPIVLDAKAGAEVVRTAKPSKIPAIDFLETPSVSPSRNGADGISEIPDNKKTILIVENDKKFREAVADSARGHGFYPIEVDTAVEALQLLKRHRVQAILLDNKFVVESGNNFLAEVRAIPGLKQVPIHMISSVDQHEIDKDAFRSGGAIGAVIRPVSITGVRAALSRIENFIDKKVKRLLIVEDDRNQRMAISELVGAKDTEIVVADNGRRALEILNEGSVDCMILDLELPDMSGLQLLEDLARDYEISLPPIVVYTGKDLSKEDEERLRRYSDSIILKGAKSPERLLDEVNLFLHRVEREAPESREIDQARVMHGFKGNSILLVDDDVRNLFALTSALEGQGFQVVVARNGIEALEKLDAHPETDVVLMDIMMPKMDGFEAIRRIRENLQYKSLPIIALTAKTMKGEDERCIQAGANDYLPKPIHLANLLSLLKVWIPRSSQMPAPSMHSGRELT